LAARTVRLAPGVDPSAVAFASRRPGERWLCFEQPSRAGSAVVGLGTAIALQASGPRRFAEVAARWRELAGAAFCEDVDGPPGSGLIALGGFAFAHDGGAAPHWAGFPPAL